jgi:hypothetical protein
MPLCAITPLFFAAAADIAAAPCFYAPPLVAAADAAAAYAPPFLLPCFFMLIAHAPHADIRQFSLMMPLFHCRCHYFHAAFHADDVFISLSPAMPFRHADAVAAADVHA